MNLILLCGNEYRLVKQFTILQIMAYCVLSYTDLGSSMSNKCVMCYISMFLYICRERERMLAYARMCFSEYEIQIK